MAVKTKAAVLDVAVEFGNVSIGEETVSIGVTVDRGWLKVQVADKVLCGKRLTGSIVANPSGTRPEQERLPGFDHDGTKVTGVFDVKGFSCKPKYIGFSLSFALESVEIESLIHFAKRTGTFQVEDAEDLPERGKGGDAEDNGEDGE